MFLSHFCGVAVIFLSIAGVRADDQMVKLSNDKVVVAQQTLAPGDLISIPTDKPGVIVYMGAGSIESNPPDGSSHTTSVKRGDVVFWTPHAGSLKNIGSAPLQVIRTEYCGSGSSEIWSTNGLVPNCNVLFENKYGRVYDIKIPAGKYEPLHTQHDRIVICLSGTKLELTLLDGTKKPATFKTDEIAWRLGGTHSGYNLGNTDYWAIAIEPK